MKTVQKNIDVYIEVSLDEFIKDLEGKELINAYNLIKDEVIISFLYNLEYFFDLIKRSE
jgi:DNA-binding protein Fis